MFLYVIFLTNVRFSAVNVRFMFLGLLVSDTLLTISSCRMVGLGM